MPPKIAIAKFAINAAVQTVVAAAISSKITQKVVIDTTAKKVAVQATSLTVGFVAAGVASSFIDPQIDKIAAWKNARKETEPTAE